MNEIDTNWDTGEVSRIIANDEEMYNTVIRLERNAYSIGRLAQRMEEALSDIISAYPYSDVNMNNVVWEEIATEYIEE